MSENELMKRYLPEIKKIKMFHYLSDDDLSKLLSGGEIVIHKMGETIISQGDVSQFFFAVLEGSVDVSVTNLGEVVHVSTISAGDVFGEAAIFIGEKRTANVTCPEQTVVLRIHKSDLLSFIKEYPHAGVKILMLVINGLLQKLGEANFEIAFEKHTYAELEDIDPMIQSIIADDWERKD